MVLQAILRFAEKGDYDMILSEGVLFARERVDVTGQVVEAMKEIDKSGGTASQ